MSELEKKKSDINGFGIFAKRSFLAGDVLYEIPTKKTFDNPRPRCARIAKDRWVDDEEILNWVNHSCDPNSILDTSTEKPFIRAIKDVNPGEEITVDYDKTEKGDVELKCNCGSENCRKKFKIIK